MKNISIEQQIDSYINDNFFKSVLLINGKWGSGKSHFIKQYFKKNDDFKSIYIDLDGTREINGIQKLINLALVTKKDVNTEISSDLANMDDVDASINLFGFKLNVKDSVENIVNNIGKKKIAEQKFVLVFDNVEKTKCDLNDILTLISDYLRSSIKIIVLANPNDLKGDYRSLLNDFISKSIVKEIVFLPNYQETALSILKENNLTLEKIVKSNKDRIFLFANAFKETNIRTFSFFINKASNIIDNIDRKYIKYLDTIIVYCFYSSVFFLDLNKHINWSDNCIFANIIFKPDNGDIQFECDGFKFVDELIINGSIDKNEINSCMKAYDKYCNAVNDDEVLQELDRWWLKDDATINDAYKKLEINLKKNNYELYIYPKIISYLTALLEVGLINNKDFNDIEKTMATNIKKGRRGEVYNWNTSPQEHTTSSAIIRLYNAIYIVENKKEYDFIHKSLNNDDWGPIIYSHYDDEDGKKDFFQLVDTKKLLNKINVNVSSKNINYLYQIVDQCFHDVRMVEIDEIQLNKLIAIDEKLTKILKEPIGKILRYNILILQNSLKDIINRIKG